jgi:hypothetical protein
MLPDPAVKNQFHTKSAVGEFKSDCSIKTHDFQETEMNLANLIKMFTI